MRFRHLLAALVPAGAASALVILPAGVAAAPQAAAATVGRVTPAVSSPLAYRYVGKADNPVSGYQYTCQEPGASPNCYTPGELAKAYDIPSAWTGAGQTIVLIDAYGDPTLTQDLAVEDKTFKIPAAKLKVVYPTGQTAFNASNVDQVNWTGEIALDVESAHAIAPAATIDLVVAKNDTDPEMLKALQYAVSHRLGSVLSQSYGEAESCEKPAIEKADHQLFETAESEGVSVFAASGDNGAAEPNCAETSYIKSVGLPAADPLVTAVGATSLTAAQPKGNYEHETAWDDSYGSSNGGYSKLFARPAYQKGFVKPSGRGVPDVSYTGDVDNGLLIAWSEGEKANVGNIYEFGGTSAGSPAWAAITALADQVHHTRLGFLNGDLYALARGSHYGAVFHDVIHGNNAVSLLSSAGATVNVAGYPATPGWDAVTGLGTPNVAELVKYLP
jgi:subtilase family serine protease